MSQISLPLTRPTAVQSAVDALSRSGTESRGAIQTRRDVVRFILDLVGYTRDQPLSKFRLLDPACGQGAFVCEAARRLLDTGARDVDALIGAIRAVELHNGALTQTRERLRLLLARHGFEKVEIEHLLDVWLVKDDFLLAELGSGFTHVVGNPPYVRHEEIPDPLVAEYKRRYDCIQGRADLYVPFLERGLQLLADDGQLGFICPDRWIKNAYGKALRELVDRQFHLSAHVDMTGTDAFEEEAIAYPSIFVIERKREDVRETAVARRPDIDELPELAISLRQQKRSDARVHVIPRATDGRRPWLLDHPDEIAVLRRLEDRYPTIEDAGMKVGIGVATGADDIYVRQNLPVEPSRRLPVIKTADINGGTLTWGGHHVLNPFAEDGSLVDLNRYPKLAAYLAEHEERIRGRYIARKYPERWYRTIDKIHPDLTGTPKLLIPDIKGEAAVAYDAGEFYPHHNVYHVTASTWALPALQAVLRSKLAEFFVAVYSVRMRGDYLRFQAQYLRRIRVPHWNSVSETMRERLREAARSDQAACDEIAFDLYGLTEAEADTVRQAVLDAKA